MGGYLIDSSVLIDHLRHHALMTSFVEHALARGFALHISAVTVAEIHAGASLDAANGLMEAEALLGNFGVVLLDEILARKAGELKRRRGLDLLDAVIAASAMLTESVLVTKNIKHFRGIPELEIQTLS